MRTVKEIGVLSPLEAYNVAVQDCATMAKVQCIGDPITMALSNFSTSSTFFAVDKDSILNLTVEAK